MEDLNRVPVIVAVGEYRDRPVSAADALEPVDLMCKALRVCEADGESPLLDSVTTLSLIGLISWQYHDPVALLCSRLGISPAEQVNASMGGDTPIRLIHEAAARIVDGEDLVAAIVGGEASHARGQARKEGIRLPWTPPASREDAVRFPSSRTTMSPIARALAATDPAQVYPFYEMAFEAAEGQSPAQGRAASAELWADYAQVAATNPAAWIQRAPLKDEIAEISAENRMISWPYSKLMVANPSVNLAAGVIVTSVAKARELGVPDAKLVYIWGGASAEEPEDYLNRDRYDHSTAQAAVLKRAVQLAGGKAENFDFLELYSCFPIVPKMALKTLALDPGKRSSTVAGGLTFLGGPLNNYMSHATAAMVRSVRKEPGKLGLLYGQGGYFNKHHTLVVSAAQSPTPMVAAYSVQKEADAAREEAPTSAENYTGPAKIETYTVVYARDGDPLHGLVIARTPDNCRVMARVPASDRDSLALLISEEQSAVGKSGNVRVDVFGKACWSATDVELNPPLRSCVVERDGHVTIITINRPSAMNALDPDTNAELARIFDDFAADPEQWVAIITGAGDRAFSAGNDLKETARRMGRGEALETPTAGFGGLTARFNLDKPVIAAVNGIAMGGGFEVALACDLIVAAQTAVFALPEPRVGLAALAGGLHRLPRQIGLKRAMGMILTGRPVSAAEGKELGFVHEIAPPGELMVVARRLADAMLELSPASLRASKQIVHRGLDEPAPVRCLQSPEPLSGDKGAF